MQVPIPDPFTELRETGHRKRNTLPVFLGKVRRCQRAEFTIGLNGTRQVETAMKPNDHGQNIRRILRLARIVIMAGLFALGPPIQALAAGEPPEKLDLSASCVNAGCHVSVSDRPHLHWPEVAEPGQCQRCHTPKADRHDFETDDSAEACLGCHKALASKISGARRIHEPAEEDCLDCHNPHGGEVKALLEDVEDEDLGELCFTCHEEDIVEKKYKHGPAGLGACNMCHDPHASNNESLLISSGLELCGGCHEEFVELIDTAEHVHDPAEDDCTDCHDPHSGSHPKMLFAEKRQLCKECHEDIVKTAEDSVVAHDATTTEEECLSCHSPHASNHAPLLKESQRSLCLDCHDKRVESGDHLLTDMAALLRDNEVWHKPVLEDDCTGCHRPHGSANFRLLKKPFPAGFYSKFSVADYGLCFSCHEKNMATVQTSRTVTRFRDGDRNLHFLHVNKERRGRSCRACHAVHASPQPLHLAERVPFGRWLMPINFKKSDTGGSCAPGCHAHVEYNREATDAVGTN
jgi:predicted CXXCH cytochrome family protein